MINYIKANSHTTKFKKWELKVLGLFCIIKLCGMGRTNDLYETKKLYKMLEVIRYMK